MGRWKKLKASATDRITDIFYFLIYSSIYLSIAGAYMAYISCVIQDIPCSMPLLFIMFLSTYSVYNINRKTDEKEDAINHSKRHSFTKKYETFLSTTAILAYILVILLALCCGIKTVVISTIPLLCGILYSIAWIPERFKYRRLKDVPFAKNIVIAFAWASTPALLPVYSTESRTGMVTFIVFIFFFMLVFINSVLFDMRDIEGDAVAGVKTIPVILGIPLTIQFLGCLNILSAIMIIRFSFVFLPVKLVLLLVAGIIYSNLYIVSFNKTQSMNLLCDAAADGQFIVIGSCLYLIR